MLLIKNVEKRVIFYNNFQGDDRKLVTEKTDNVLQVADYAVFASTLLLSAIIGIYFGFINRNKSAKVCQLIVTFNKV